MWFLAILGGAAQLAVLVIYRQARTVGQSCAVWLQWLAASVHWVPHSTHCCLPACLPA